MIPWTKLALALPQLIGVAVQLVEQFKGTTGQEKSGLVVSQLPNLAAGIDGAGVLEVVDPVVRVLLHDYISARVALMNGISDAAAGGLGPNAPPA